MPLRVPLKALQVVQPAPTDVSVTLRSDGTPPSADDLAAIEAKYRSGEVPLSVALVQLQTTPAPEAPQGRSLTQKALGTGPMIGGTVGALAGGVPGAAIGGAAGEGYEELARHATEIPGAVADVARNLIAQPRATLKGAAAGMKEGAEASGLAGAVNAGMEAGGQALMSGIGSGAKAVYRGYLKPSLAEHSIADARAIVNTALDEGLPIARGGVDEANKIIGQLRGKVESILRNHQQISKTVHGDIDLHGVADDLRQWARDTFYRAGRPPEDFEAALRVADNIDKHPSLNLPPGSAPGAQPATLTEANTVKRTLQNSAGDRAYGVERSAAQEAEKSGGYLLRKEIELRAPKVAPLNARESKLIDAAKAIAHAVEREANQNALVGVKSVLAAGAGGAEYGRTGNPWTAAAKALAFRYAMSPGAASQLAILAYRIGKLPGVAPASAARLALAVASEKVAGDER